MAIEASPSFSWSREAGSLRLEELLLEARDAFTGELAIPISTSRPPAIHYRDGHGDLDVEMSYGAQVGESLSAPMVRRLGHPNGYGNTFPMARALYDLEGWCRGRHLDAAGGPWEDHFQDIALGLVRDAAGMHHPPVQRPLCARLAWYTVAWSESVAWAASVEQISLERATRLLELALRHAWEQRREWANGPDSGVGEVLAAQRRERREARKRAAASATSNCRYCGKPYDRSSTEPCAGDPANQISPAEAAMYADLGVTLLCSPGEPA